MAMKTQSAGSAGSLLSTSAYSDTSKSGSSKSDDNKSNAEKEQDLTKDNAASPIDLECHIQTERITKIIEETIYKTKLALCLHDLVHEYRTLNRILTAQHMDELIFIFEHYANPLFTASLLNLEALEEMKTGDVSLKTRLNPELGHLLYIINSYKELRPIVENMANQKKAEYLKHKGIKETIAPIEYLLAFEHFRDLMVKQMNTTAAEELAHKFQTRKMEASNARYMETIQEYNTALKDEQESFEQVMSAKSNAIARLEQELSVLNHEAGIKLKKKVIDSDRQMVLMSRRHQIRNEMLKDEEQETREGYENLLWTHLNEEKALRMRRFKAETQLLSWLQKYDLEMSDKQELLDDLDQKHKDETAKVKKLTLDLEEQDKEYIPLMAERDAEYHEEMKAKMHEFLIDHAARVIQNAWRQVLHNRHEKKKLKNIWKKIKEAQDRAEKLQEKKEAEEQKAAGKKKKKETE